MVLISAHTSATTADSATSNAGCRGVMTHPTYKPRVAQYHAFST